MTAKFNTDFPAVSRDEATQLCVYHLRLATALFEVVPDDNNETILKEIARQCGDEAASIGAAQSWCTAMLAYHNDLKAQFND